MPRKLYTEIMNNIHVNSKSNNMSDGQVAGPTSLQRHETRREEMQQVQRLGIYYIYSEALCECIKSPHTSTRIIRSLFVKRTTSKYDVRLN